MAQAGQERLQRFCGLLAGRHSNQQQAFDNPPFFAHIILKYRALPQFDQPTLLLEQGYAVDPSQPYRVRILRPTLQGETSIRVINFRLHELQRFQGASDDRMIRDTIAETAFGVLEGCAYDVTPSGHSTFAGTTEPGCRCIVHRNGVDTYLKSRFQLSPEGMTTLDRGYDLTSHQRVWGSVAGEFSFQREEDWSDEIPPHWWR